MSIRLSLKAIFLSGAVLAQPAFALTAPEVWQEWQNSLTLLGQQVEVANEAYSGGVLRLEGITQRMPIDPEVGRNITFIDALVLTEQTDGTVRIDLDGGYRVDFGGISDGERSDGSISITFDGLDSVARGAPGEIVYDFNADLAQLRLDELTSNGTPVPVAFNLAATDLQSVTRQAGAAYTGDGRIAALAMTLDASDPQDGSVSMNYGLTDVTFEGGASYADVAEAGAGDPSAVFRSETPTEFLLSHSAASLTADVSGPEGDGTITGRAEAGRLEGRFGQGRALYAAAIDGLDLRLTGGGLPVPLDLTSEELSFRIDGPMLAARDPQSFEAQLAIAGLALPDLVWQSIDPAGALPRDPASLVLRMSGLAQLDQNLADPMIGQGQPPGDLLALALEAFSLSVAGASADATGALTFEPDAPGLQPGLPAAAGNISIALRGVNGLMDQLAQLGALSQEQVMAGRMMLGMFARPGPNGGDEMVSEIELGADGSFSANGMRLR